MGRTWSRPRACKPATAWSTRARAWSTRSDRPPMFKWLLDSSLANRLLVIIAGLVLVAYGGFTLTTMPVDVFPDLNKPTVTIMTEAGGMAAEEVEQLITF